MAKERGRAVITSNRKARHDYHIEDTFEAGLALTGTEVKALRMGRASLADGFAQFTGDELWLEGVHIPEYSQGTWTNHAPRRRRKLLLHREELEKISTKTREKGRTVVPLVPLLEERAGQGRDRPGHGQAGVRQAQLAAGAAGPPGGGAGDEHAGAPVTHAVRRRLLALWAVLAAALLLVALPAAGYASPASASPVSPAAPAVAAANDAYDRMASYTADIVVDPDGGATFTETIDYRFGTSGGRKHGIIRNIVTRQAVADSEDGSYRYYALDLESVTSPTGASATTKVTDGSDGATEIRIGDAKTYVDGYAQTYVLNYHLANIVNPIDAGGRLAAASNGAATAELFYNVFKSDPIPKDTVKITVKGPAAVTQVKCVRGQHRPRHPVRHRDGRRHRHVRRRQPARQREPHHRQPVPAHRLRGARSPTSAWPGRSSAPGRPRCSRRWPSRAASASPWSPPASWAPSSPAAAATSGTPA